LKRGVCVQKDPVTQRPKEEKKRVKNMKTKRSGKEKKINRNVMRGKNQDTLKENTTKKDYIEMGKITEEMTNK
jgi:hypothetical protein